MKEIIIKILVNKYFLLVILILVGLFSSYLFGHDNPIEEYSEKTIKEQTGVDVDLTPASKEEVVK